MSLLNWGLVSGALFGSGLLLVWRGLPRNRRTVLMDRVGPYLRDEVAIPSTLLSGAVTARGWVPVLTPVLGPTLSRAARLVDQVIGDGATVRRRLLRAGRAPDVELFRVQQVLAGLAGAGVALLMSMIGLATGQLSAIVAVVMVLIGAAIGVVGWDQVLSRRATAREERMLAEFPTIAEFLALAVGAGEGAVGALDRVCRLSRGDLSSELRHCLSDARAGASLPVALTGLADRTGLPSLARFVDGIVVAVERGTPLSEVLRAQAQDVREAGRRAIMETAGRKEILMMVPVVFFILPTTIVFALFPGLSFFDFTI
ncbi:MAG TPA: type II secretion system F family protein [Phycicoccus sp.]|jgi:tight adherence protein C|nr:type II secretion system F family protein [Phycicoccus sp.]HQY97909.1 type II secretion system F family protein [Phycicoccus sp.]